MGQQGGVCTTPSSSASARPAAGDTPGSAHPRLLAAQDTRTRTAALGAVLFGFLMVIALILVVTGS